MKTLFIDASKKSLSIALKAGDELLFISNVDSHSKHSNFLMNEIDKILNKANLNIKDIDNIIVLNGPGSFTGVRVGVTVAKTLSWTLNKRLYILSNLEALKVGIYNDVVISVIKDKDNYSYVGIYEDNKIIEEYLSIDDERLNIKNKNISLVSFEENVFLNSLREKLENNNCVKTIILEDYDYEKLISFALSKNSIDVHSAKPIYLKKIDAEKKNGN